jgi:hypothetical protein
VLRVLCLYPYMRVSTFQCFSLSHLCTNIVSSPKFSACSVTGVASYFFSWKNEMSTFVALCFYLSWSCLAGACVSGHRVCLSIKFETGVHRGYAGGGFLFLRFSFSWWIFRIVLCGCGLKRSCRAQWAQLDLLQFDDDATKEG